MSPNAMNVSVIIPALNASRTLPSLFDALQMLDPAPAEIIFVDNGSIDESLALLRSFQQRQDGATVEVLVEKRRGAAAARNAGIRAAMGKILAFTDSDCAPAVDWLAHLVEPFTDSAVGAVAGRVEGAVDGSLLELFSSLYTLRPPPTPSRHNQWSPGGGGYPTANFAVRSCLALELGGFNEQIRIYGEDYDFCARLYARKVVIEYNPRARVTHHHRTKVLAMLRQAFGFGRGHAYMLRHHGASILWIQLPGHTLSKSGSPIAVWFDLCGADKKVLLLVAISTIVPPFFLLLAFYAAYLSAVCSRRAQQAGVPVGPSIAAKLAGLLLLKSTALTAGRWWGSAKYKCLCL